MHDIAAVGMEGGGSEIREGLVTIPIPCAELAERRLELQMLLFQVMSMLPGSLIASMPQH